MQFTLQRHGQGEARCNRAQLIREIREQTGVVVTLSFLPPGAVVIPDSIDLQGKQAQIAAIVAEHKPTTEGEP